MVAATGYMPNAGFFGQGGSLIPWGEYGPERIIVRAGEPVQAGTLLALVDDVYWPFDPDASDGTEIPSALLMLDSVADGATATVAATGGECTVLSRLIRWPGGITPEQQADALEALEGVGITFI
jgi:hypothetical protein